MAAMSSPARPAFALFLALAAFAESTSDPLDAWTRAKVRPLTSTPGRHSIHAYINTTPESPDGKFVLFYTSTEREGYSGEIRIADRATGKEEILVRNVTVEDAHRAACQQWVSGGKRIVFHDYRGGEWMVLTVDIATKKERILAKGRMVSWGQPAHDLVPIYGPHWAPGEHRDLELVNAATGEIRKVVRADEVRARYSEMVAKEFGSRPISIFFPVLSPDLKRVFFKLATPKGTDFRSKDASHREQLIAYHLDEKRFLFGRARWGHPAWLPDSRTIMNMNNVLIDSDDGAERTIPGLPVFRGSHPSVSPLGDLWVTDSLMESFGGKPGEWGVALAGMRGGRHEFLHRFDNGRGAASWRVSHPHPAFSSDGQRVYFNVNDTSWTQLYVAELPPPERSPSVRAPTAPSRATR